ncbi:LacI family DNA-binding transcriptional regulator [Tropicimonas sediminicola]|nr:LacI family DNA-binding transcriptional regulator [Tropicimonas sediminicola]
MAEGRVTADDVAQRAGVSRATVSRAFSRGHTVQEQTRERILKAAQELGYQPNALAQALTSRRSQIVGILMGQLKNPIHAVLHQSISMSLQQNNFIPISGQLGADEDLAKLIATFRQYQVGVVILTSMNISPGLVQEFQAAGLQVLLLNRIDDDAVAASVCADLTQGGNLAARLLVERGCSRIAVAKGAPGHWTSAARLAGHLAGLERMGQAPAKVFDGGYTYQDGARVADTLLSEASDMPDGFLCPNDLFAIGLMDRLRAASGLRFPEDMKVVGFDDIPMAEWESNQLTTIRLPVHAMAKRAAEVITRMVVEGEKVEEKIWIPCRLIERGSA